ncbi:MAG: hypothetical protein ACI94D_001090 [Neolewinella sp.]|jgi:hypothetical protein
MAVNDDAISQPLVIYCIVEVADVEHLSGVLKRVMMMKIQPGMYQYITWSFEVKWQGSHPGGYLIMVTAGWLPLIEIMLSPGGLEQHLFVVTPQALHVVAIFSKFLDQVDHALAVWAPVDVIPQKKEFVVAVQLEFIQQGSKGFKATVNVGNCVAHRGGVFGRLNAFGRQPDCGMCATNCTFD